jgi:catechol 2,3-dioxygenase-like lactoylglutathione lyase family enzyme
VAVAVAAVLRASHSPGRPEGGVASASDHVHVGAAKAVDDAVRDVRRSLPRVWSVGSSPDQAGEHAVRPGLSRPVVAIVTRTFVAGAVWRARPHRLAGRDRYPDGRERAVHIDLVTIVVNDYEPAIAFFVGVLGFELVEDSPALTNDGRPKRWVVVRPPGAETGVLLARADGERQAAAVGNQVAGRVGFFLRVHDFEGARERLTAAGVEFVSPPRTEPYGRVAVFLDIAGNRWDLLGPA